MKLYIQKLSIETVHTKALTCQIFYCKINISFTKLLIGSMIFNCDSSSIGRNVGRSVSLSVGLSTTSFIAVLCYWQCIYIVTRIVVQIIRLFCSHILHFQLCQQLYRSHCQPVCLSVRNKFYGSVMLLLVHDCCYCCCSL